MLDDARAHADCFVNLTILTAALAFASFAMAVISADWRHLKVLVVAEERYLPIALISLLVCVCTYVLAAMRAVIWGELVKAAFDCYLPALINQLGFLIPQTDAARREFWSEFNDLILYKQLMTPNRWPLLRERGVEQEAGKTAETAKTSEFPVETEAPMEAVPPDPIEAAPSQTLAWFRRKRSLGKEGGAVIAFSRHKAQQRRPGTALRRGGPAMLFGCGL